MIIARIAGDIEVIKRFGGLPPSIREQLAIVTRREAIGFTRYVKEEKLSGQVLKNRTGTLRRKVNYQVTETPNEVAAAVGVKLAYAAAHEFGFEGQVSVREHLRAAKAGTFNVRAHTRHMRLPQRSFLRSSLAELGPGIRQRLHAAVTKAIR
jgi:phage gpG-like protein